MKVKPTPQQLELTTLRQELENTQNQIAEAKENAKVTDNVITGMQIEIRKLNQRIVEAYDTQKDRRERIKRLEQNEAALRRKLPDAEIAAEKSVQARRAELEAKRAALLKELKELEALPQ